MVNRGEEKVKVHMNVVPRSTMNTNGVVPVIPFTWANAQRVFHGLHIAL